MKAIVATIITCLVLFSVSAAASWYLNQPEDNQEQMADTDTEQNEDPEADETSLPGKQPEVQEKVEAMPVSHRPSQTLSLEAMLQMSRSMKQMEAKLLQRKQLLQKEEQRVKVMYEDLRRERKELKSFNEGIEAKLETMKQLSAEMKQTLTEIEKKQAESQKVVQGPSSESQASEIQNKVDKVKGWFANLEAPQAAEYLKEFANNGQLEFAAALIQKMSDRQKSKILSSLNDPTLVGQLIDSLNIPDKK